MKVTKSATNLNTDALELVLQGNMTTYTLAKYYPATATVIRHSSPTTITLVSRVMARTQETNKQM